MSRIRGHAKLDSPGIAPIGRLMQDPEMLELEMNMGKIDTIAHGGAGAERNVSM